MSLKVGIISHCTRDRMEHQTIHMENRKALGMGTFHDRTCQWYLANQWKGPDPTKSVLIVLKLWGDMINYSSIPIGLPGSSVSV